MLLGVKGLNNLPRVVVQLWPNRESEPWSLDHKSTPILCVTVPPSNR